MEGETSQPIANTDMDESHMNETSDSRIVVQGHALNILPRYADPVKIGDGAYGFVVSALDTCTGNRVAIKQVKPLNHQTFCQRTLREIIILSQLKHDNIVRLLDIIVSDEKPLSEVYLVLNLMETDLHKLLKNLRHQKEYLTESHTCFFLYQMFLGIKFIHSANVLHRDLKPGNMLINLSNCDLRICDFGLARVYDPDFVRTGTLTEYVATRWYRAPEVMVQQRAYTRAMDIWSLGCIFAEMLSNKPLFPGRNYIDQINKIIAVIGTPGEEALNEIPNERSREFLESLPRQAPVPFHEIYPQRSSICLDLLKKLLEFSPLCRLTADQALEHPYFAEYHDPEDEPVALNALTMEYEPESLSIPQLCDEIYHHGLRFREMHE